MSRGQSKDENERLEGPRPSSGRLRLALPMALVGRGGAAGRRGTRPGRQAHRPLLLRGSQPFTRSRERRGGGDCSEVQEAGRRPAVRRRRSEQTWVAQRRGGHSRRLPQ